MKKGKEWVNEVVGIVFLSVNDVNEELKEEGSTDEVTKINTGNVVSAE